MECLSIYSGPERYARISPARWKTLLNQAPSRDLWPLPTVIGGGVFELT
jgi:hypothetical protein